jgi:hypothetical protein
VQAAGQWPVLSQIWLPVLLLQHCTLLGAQSTQAPLRQYAQVCVCGVPVASHQLSVVVLLQLGTDGLQVPVHMPGVPLQAKLHVEVTHAVPLQVCS